MLGASVPPSCWKTALVKGGAESLSAARVLPGMHWVCAGVHESAK